MSANRARAGSVVGCGGVLKPTKVHQRSAIVVVCRLTFHLFAAFDVCAGQSSQSRILVFTFDTVSFASSAKARGPQRRAPRVGGEPVNL
jgi:hypothetical protein